MREVSTILRSARANQENEDEVMRRLDDARIMRDLCWVDFYSNLDSTDTERLRHKLSEWEMRDDEVRRLEVKAGLFTQHHKWFANYERLLEVGYKE